LANTKVKFGVLLPTLTSTFDLASSAAKVAEKNGFASVWCIDHIICEPEFYRLLGVNSDSFKLLGTWTTLTAVAVQTKKVMLGTAVSPVPRYNPTFLAKMVTTLDVVSKGRTILGVGAGHHKPEFELNDFPWKTVHERIQMMHEGVEIIKKLWTQSRTTYFGKYFKVKEAPHEPKPIQKPHPAIWVGGNIPAMLKETAENAGRKPKEIEPAYFMDTCIGLDEKQTIKKAKLYIEAGHEKTFEKIKHHGAYGTPETVVDQIGKFIEAGVKHFVLVLVPQKDTLNSIQLYSEKVLPQFI
jgi:alkanesulfonate monooxygenase SsuD/methylene tetrahydromethanopterin reductase-like flavin-dependent oxidoreductase (luciferase family)